jgi:hypothetical protein
MDFFKHLPGTYGDAEGFTNEKQCKTCPAGSYCPVGTEGNPTIIGTKCPPGTYNPNKGTSEVINCLLCPAGRKLPWKSIKKESYHHHFFQNSHIR